ncbi:hypothetical protein G6F68_014458 [Rhizopus microsporus]|nr:hypothetical protein G6F68_014458 [Rhizopus microsporus]
MARGLSGAVLAHADGRRVDDGGAVRPRDDPGFSSGHAMRGGQHLAGGVAACAGGGVRGSDPQHAAAGAAVRGVLRPGLHRFEILGDRVRGARADHQYRRLFQRDHPRRHPGAAPRPAGSQPRAGPVVHADNAARDPAAGALQHAAQHAEPVPCRN